MALLRMSPDALRDLGNRISDDYDLAKTAHQTRMDRYAEAFKRWRNRVDAPRVGEEDKSNLRVPLTQEQVMARVARDVTGLFGDDAEIVALPTGESDSRRAPKIGKYMTWRVLRNMERFPQRFTTFDFRRILFGRAHAYTPWKRDEYVVIQDGKRKPALWYDGPEFRPLWPDDLIVPAEEAETIHDFSFVIRKVRLTLADLLRGRAAKRYQFSAEDEDRIRQHVKSATADRDTDGDEVKREADESIGVLYEGAGTQRGTVLMYEWYGKMEPDEDGNEQEVVSFYLPELTLCIGAQDLMELYPMSRYRRPFVESALVPYDGCYWGMGIEELMEMMEDEMTANENLFADAAQFSIGPVTFYKPSAMNPDKIVYGPFTAIPTEDPNGIRVVQPTVNPQAYVMRQQALRAQVERTGGVSDFGMGRMIDRPNAPRTASGQIALIEQGNIRVGLDTSILAQDASEIVSKLWALECEFRPDQRDGEETAKGRFFRVTEQDAGGLFEVSNGGALMMAEEFAGRYDFQLKFATSIFRKEAKKQEFLALYQALLPLPIVAQDAKAQWNLASQLAQKFGMDNFSDVIPKPPDMGLPKDPKQEWNLALEGEFDEITVNPQDNDELHIIDHLKRMKEESRRDLKDTEALAFMLKHVLEHKKQQEAKRLMQAMVETAAEAVPQLMGGAMGGAPEEQPGMAQETAGAAPEQPMMQGPQPGMQEGMVQQQ